MLVALSVDHQGCLTRTKSTLKAGNISSSHIHQRKGKPHLLHHTYVRTHGRVMHASTHMLVGSAVLNDAIQLIPAVESLWNHSDER